MLPACDYFTKKGYYVIRVGKKTNEKIKSKNPKIIDKDSLATKAVQIMEKHSISSLIVSKDQRTIDGVIHIQDLLKAGIL